MQRFVGLVLVVLITCGMSLIAAQAVGAALRPPALGLLTPGQCAPHPCWFGLRTGQTTFAPACRAPWWWAM